MEVPKTTTTITRERSDAIDESPVVVKEIAAEAVTDKAPGRSITKTTTSRKIGETIEHGTKTYIYENTVTWTDKSGNKRKSVYIQRTKYTPVGKRAKKMDAAHIIIGKIVRANCDYMEIYKMYRKLCEEINVEEDMIISYSSAVPIIKEKLLELKCKSHDDVKVERVKDNQE